MHMWTAAFRSAFGLEVDVVGVAVKVLVEVGVDVEALLEVDEDVVLLDVDVAFGLDAVVQGNAR